MDWWTNKIGEITFANRPSAYDKFMADVKSLYGDLQPIFGLEDTRGFGRNFAFYLLGHKYTVTVTDEMGKDLNRVLGKYGITNVENIQHFYCTNLF